MDAAPNFTEPNLCGPTPLDAAGFESGIFAVDKPAGVTSFAIVQQVRRLLGIKKVGHAGTLDPFATGLLLIAAGRPATRIIPRLMAGEKIYQARMRLGIETDTQDVTGNIVSECPIPSLDRQQVNNCLSGFLGEYLQTPPRYSALKFRGKPLYYYARKGIEVDKEPRMVRIGAISLLALEDDAITIEVTCGKGTYIRALATDIGRELGCGAHLQELRRLRSGPFTVARALPGQHLTNRESGHRCLLEHRHTVDEILALL